MFPKVPGVGRKTIEKVIIELKNSFSVDEMASDESENSHDARLALETLGYSSKDIATVIGKIDKTLSMNDIIRQALQILSKTK
jgi:Holliday junction DNA helicase RuvA